METGNPLDVAHGVSAPADLPSSVEQAREQIRRSTRILCALFFFSGFPALIYQLIWHRALFRIFGVNIESVTIVVTAFMLGLGIGSLAGGWLSKRRDIALLPLLATIELATGAFGMVWLAVFDGVGALALGLPLPAIALVALALVALPTLLMGATLPILVGYLASRTGNVGSSVGRLYYCNTLGAGAACLASAMLLFPFLGMQGSVYVAAGMNTAVAVGALSVHWRDRGRTFAAIPEHTVTATAAPALRFAPVLALVFVGGFVSLSYEIFFVRTLSYATGGSATAFPLTLCAFLVGLASGSRRASEWCEAHGGVGTQAGNGAWRPVTSSLLKANVCGVLFLPIIAHLAWLGQGMLGVALLMVYLLARFWGALLPCLAHLGVAADAQAGMRTALLYLTNIAGSVLGSILTGFVLMDRLGLVQIGMVLALAGLACMLLLDAALPVERRTKWRHAAYATALAAVTVGWVPAASSGVLETLLWKGTHDTTESFAHVIENRSGIITVAQDGEVFGNGMYDGRFNVDLLHDTNGIVRPFALSLFHPHPSEVLMIGLASGSWAQVIANNPQVNSLTIVEINPGYLSLMEQAQAVASVLRNPKVRIVIDDGRRRWLLSHRARQFDAIVSNTTWYFRSNASNLLSTEFLTLAKSHLKPGGIFYYNTTDSARVQRAACQTFPYGVRFTNHMVVSQSPVVPDAANWRRVLDAYRIDGRSIVDIGSAAGSGENSRMPTWQIASGAESEKRLAEWIEPCEQILARTAGKRGVTDDNMGSEWRHAFGVE